MPTPCLTMMAYCFELCGLFSQTLKTSPCMDRVGAFSGADESLGFVSTLSLHFYRTLDPESIRLPLRIKAAGPGFAARS